MGLGGQRIKKSAKLVGNIFSILLIVIIAISIFNIFQTRANPNKVPSIMGYKFMSVLTGSMQPALKPGDMIIAKEVGTENIKEGDVITYWIDSKTLVTHRVIEIVRQKGEKGNVFFKTKGDANNTEDSGLVASDKVVGSLAFNIPKGGYVANFVKSSKGFLLFIVLPIVLLMTTTQSLRMYINNLRRS